MNGVSPTVSSPEGLFKGHSAARTTRVIHSKSDQKGRQTPVRCPFCRNPDSRVLDSRDAEDGTVIRRRRSCPECGKRFTTVEQSSLLVVKRSGATEPFSRDKVLSGVKKACQGRPVDDDRLALLAQRVEEAVRAMGIAEIDAYEVGLAVLVPLRELDEVAYLRYASVYRNFESLADFEAEIAGLRLDHDGRPRREPNLPMTEKERQAAESGQQ